jgi:hypothetical protein
MSTSFGWGLNALAAEQSDRKELFGSGMAAIGAVWLFMPAVCSLLTAP